MSWGAGDEVRSILRRVGWVLIAVFAISATYGAYMLASGASHNLTVEFGGLIAGIFLMRGSLRAATIVRWIAVFLIPLVIGGMLVPVAMNPGFWLARAHLQPTSLASESVVSLVYLLGLLWTLRELNREPVTVACERAGRPVRRLYIPGLLGAAVLVGITSVLLYGLHGPRADRAVAAVRQELGPDYDYRLTQLNVSRTNAVTSVSAVVTAWKQDEIRTSSASWTETE